MMTSRVQWLIALASSWVMSGCANTNFHNTDARSDAEKCVVGDARCNGNLWQTCVDGFWQEEDCGSQMCVPEQGCRLCMPETEYCRGQDTFICSADGSSEEQTGSCKPEQQCAIGMCLDLCDLQQKDRSNVGCEFWAVDLPNEYYCMSMDQGVTCATYGCAACQQFSVVVANTSRFIVGVSVEINEAAPGKPPQLETIQQKEIGPESLEIFNLPMREVDCTEWQNDSTGKLRRKNDSQTCLSSRAFRIKSTYPVVAYQFNPMINDFSNGSSLLIPTNGLDTSYLTMGWPTTNPLQPFDLFGNMIEGIPDYSNLTIVGIGEKTKVDITVSHPVQGSSDGKIPPAKPGETISVELGPFDVLNLNTIQDAQYILGDLTGTLVKASQPVAVFSGGQRASVPINLDQYAVRPPEPAGDYDVCCTEHFEQQMFPISSLGKAFAISRTPTRSTAAPEPDFYRILAAEDGTKIETSLYDFPQFQLNGGQVANFWSQKDFTISSNKPIMVAQFAVAQGYLNDFATGAGGDPEFVVFPPAEQHRKEYVFLTPTTFTNDYVVITAPGNANIFLDDQEISTEFNQRCVFSNIGKVNTIEYNAYRCKVEDGVHWVKSDEPVGIMVYGYYSVGSYGYPGGADVKQINID